MRKGTIVTFAEIYAILAAGYVKRTEKATGFTIPYLTRAESELLADLAESVLDAIGN